MKIKRALLSVSDKRGLVDLAKILHAKGVEIISTGGTAKVLLSAGIPVRAIDDLTGFPEMMDGRVKTLHPKVHGGLLNRRDHPEDREAMAKHGIVDIDLVVVNLYPFIQTVLKPHVTWAEAIENIDIGGPSMVRSAAKNHAFVTVVVDPDDYNDLIDAIEKEGQPSEMQRKKWALKAYRHTAAYDSAISEWMGEQLQENVLSFPKEISFSATMQQSLRYGENPHQKAAVYRQPLYQGISLLHAEQLQGKELSFNNLNDGNAALEMILDFRKGPAAVAVKHTNPCGAAYGSTLAEAFQRCHDADPVSIYGGIVALNRIVDAETARLLVKLFLEVIIAPDFDADAREILAKKANLRLLVVGEMHTEAVKTEYQLKHIKGGLLVQSTDQVPADSSSWSIGAGPTPHEGLLSDAEFAWTLVKHVKSNAIVVVKDGVSLGIGAGQMNRIDSTRHALRQAGERARGAVLASDAFFPFADSVEAARDAGIALIIEPSGAQRQQEVLDAARSAGIMVMLSPERHFKH